MNGMVTRRGLLGSLLIVVLLGLLATTARPALGRTLEPDLASRPQSTTEEPLTVTVSGSGSGSVTDEDGRLNCPGTCGRDYPQGTDEQLTATPANGDTVIWSGCTTSSGDTCSITMNAAETVNAEFVPAEALSVDVGGSGNGTVSDASGAINCPGTCSASYPSGTQVVLTATPANGATVGWTGCTSSSGDTCSVTLAAATTVDATFSVSQVPLRVTVAGPGSGTVTDASGAIDCPGVCSATYPTGSQVTLTAVPTNGDAVSWSGCTTVSGDKCTVAMSASEAVAATFEPLETLTVQIEGTGSGTVSDPSGAIACPTACSGTYPSGSTVQLTAAPAPNDTVNWIGCTSSNGDTCDVTITSADTVYADFEAPAPTNLDAPTITGPTTHGTDYRGPTSLILHGTWKCLPGSWSAPISTYAYVVTIGPSDGGLFFNSAAPNGAGNTAGSNIVNVTNLIPDAASYVDPDGYLENSPVWEGHITVSCAVIAVGSDGVYGDAESVDYPVVPPRPVQLTAPQITPDIPAGSVDTCQRGTYRYLYGALRSKFSYTWLLGVHGGEETVGRRPSVHVLGAWVGHPLLCRVTVDPETGWPSFSGVSQGYVVEAASHVVTLPSIAATTQDPSGSVATNGTTGVSVAANQVRLFCHPGTWSTTERRTSFSYALVPAYGSKVDRQSLSVDMTPGHEQLLDATVRCSVTLRSSRGTPLGTAESGPVTLSSGCVESIEDTGEGLESAFGNADDWAYFDEANLPGLIRVEPPDTQTGPSTLQGPGVAAKIDNLTTLMTLPESDFPNTFSLQITPYTVRKGLFGFKYSGIPSLKDWNLTETELVVTQNPGARDPDIESTPIGGPVTPEHDRARLRGTSCTAYATYLTKAGYHVQEGPVYANELIPPTSVGSSLLDAVRRGRGVRAGRSAAPGRRLRGGR